MTEDRDVCEVLEAGRLRPSSLACAVTVGPRASREGGGGAFMGRLPLALPGREAAVELAWLM